MKKIILEGKTKLVGNIKVSGAKNSALKMICASVLLKNGTLKLSNIPNLLDMTTLIYLQNHLGGKMILDGDTSNKGKGKVIILDNTELNSYVAPYSIVSQMRASFVILGPLLARFGKAEVSLPGGCALGSRPVDIHLDGFKQMGVDIELELPPKEVYKTIKDVYPEGMSEHFVTSISRRMNNNTLKEALAKGLTDYYESTLSDNTKQEG